MRSFIFFSLLSLLLSTFHSAAGRNIVYEACRLAAQDNVNYSFCTASLMAIPASQRANLQKLGISAITLVQKNIISTMGEIKKVLKKKGLKKDVNKSSTACLNLFTQAMDDLKDAVENYKSKNFYEVNQDISAISSAATSCEDEFKNGGVASPLKKSNDNTSQLSAIALKVVNFYAKVN